MANDATTTYQFKIGPVSTQFQAILPLQLSLVDVFGMAASANFILMMVNPTTTVCKNAVLAPPVIQD